VGSRTDQDPPASGGVNGGVLASSPGGFRTSKAALEGGPLMHSRILRIARLAASCVNELKIGAA
jgi:hypothetical protein